MITLQYVMVFKNVIKAWDKWGHFNLDCVVDADMRVLNFLVSVGMVWIPLLLEQTC